MPVATSLSGPWTSLVGGWGWHGVVVVGGWVGDTLCGPWKPLVRGWVGLRWHGVRRWAGHCDPGRLWRAGQQGPDNPPTASPPHPHPPPLTLCCPHPYAAFFLAADVTNITMAHIHIGNATTSGLPVVILLPVNGTATNGKLPTLSPPVDAAIKVGVSAAGPFDPGTPPL